jgi:hypothetical protein
MHAAATTPWSSEDASNRAEWEVEGAGEDADAVAGAEEHFAVGPAGAGDPELGRARAKVGVSAVADASNWNLETWKFILQSDTERKWACLSS